MNGLLPFLIALAATPVGAAQQSDGFVDAVMAAIEAGDAARLQANVAGISHGEAGDPMTAQALIGMLSGCAFRERRDSPYTGRIFLNYVCPGRHKAATGCLNGDLSVILKPTRAVKLYEVTRDDPECAPPTIVPPPPGGSNG